MNTEIRQLLAQGVTVVTPTKRLSRHLQALYASFQVEEGRLAWPSADVLPWAAWLKRSWESICTQEDIELILLNVYQRQTLWQQVIAGSQYAQHLLQIATTAKQAIDAWSLLQKWQIHEFPSDIYLNEDVRVFNSWKAAYENKCNSENWFDEDRLPTVYSQEITRLKLQLDQKIAFIGFNEFNPQQQSLLANLERAGCSIIRVKQETSRKSIQCAGSIDSRHEVRAAASWVRQLLENENNPAVGVVVPDLHRLRDLVESEFDDVLLPAEILSPAEIERRPYSISLGKSLSEYPIIDTALNVLGLGRQSKSLSEISDLLRSPFLKGAQSELIERAQLDAGLRDNGESTLSLKTLLSVATNKFDETQRSSIFLSSLQAWHETTQSLPAKQNPDRWAETFSSLLNTFGWPGERSLSSAEYQTVHAWKQVISRLASLELVTGDLSYSAALTQLRRLTTEFSFQPETQEAPVQVLGMNGAAEMQFEYLWIMGLHEEVWPPAAQPNPFIPFKLQADYEMPRANAEVELERARIMTRQLVDSSPYVVLSYPENEGERILRPSPILNPYIRNADKLQIEVGIGYAADIFRQQRLEVMDDVCVPIIDKEERVGGGTALFKDQSACPFRAFARHRLHATGLSDVDIGLDALDRGSIVHHLMQIFWDRVKSQQSLLGLDKIALEEIIEDCVTHVINNNRKKRPNTFTDRFTSLEIERLKELVKEWLEQERRRSAFIVLASEQEHRCNIENIEIRTRIDRVDELSDGSQVIVDYKTGQTSVSAWFGERPDDPQLPLYAVNNDTHISAITFARVKRGETAYVGLTENHDILPKTKAYAGSRYAGHITCWQDLIASWKKVLSVLAKAFSDGDARVNPKNVDTCSYCDLHALCRIYEQRVTTAEFVENAE